MAKNVSTLIIDNKVSYALQRMCSPQAFSFKPDRVEIKDVYVGMFPPSESLDPDSKIVSCSHELLYSLS